MKRPSPEQVLRFAEKHKRYFGFAEYSLTLKDKGNTDSESAAMVEVDWLERRLDITIYKNFYESQRDWRSDIIHEFIHGALGKMQDEIDKKKERLQYLEEEKFVNKLTDSFMELLLK